MRTVMILCALGAASSAVARPQKADTPREEASVSEPLRTERQNAQQNSPSGPDNPSTGKVLGDIATQPLQDTNIKTRRIPEVLELARGDPYSMTGLRNCTAISTKIGDLTKVLGADFDTPEDRRPNRGRQAANVGRSVVQSLIPLRGVIREVTGAAGAQRQWDAAVDAGIARRGFLRGIAKSRGCRIA
jgi:hypothetical protein